MARPRILFAAVATATCLLAFAAPAVAACSGSGSRPTRATLARATQATVCLINRARSQHGLGAVHVRASLARAARAHSRDMVRRGYFDHTSPGGSTPSQRVRRSGYLDGAHSWAVGETLAWGTGRLATPASIVRGWLNSPGHRAILLDGRYRHLGIGIVLGTPRAGPSGATFTGDFGARD